MDTTVLGIGTAFLEKWIGIVLVGYVTEEGLCYLKAVFTADIRISH